MRTLYAEKTQDCETDGLRIAAVLFLIVAEWALNYMVHVPASPFPSPHEKEVIRRRRWPWGNTTSSALRFQ